MRTEPSSTHIYIYVYIFTHVRVFFLHDRPYKKAETTSFLPPLLFFALYVVLAEHAYLRLRRSPRTKSILLVFNKRDSSRHACERSNSTTSLENKKRRLLHTTTLQMTTNGKRQLFKTPRLPRFFLSGILPFIFRALS